MQQQNTRMEVFGLIQSTDTARALFDACLSSGVVVDGPDHRFPVFDGDDYTSFKEEMLACASAGRPLVLIAYGKDPDMKSVRAVCENSGLSYYATPFLFHARGCVAWVYRPGMDAPKEIDTDERRRPRVSMDRLSSLVDDPTALQDFVRTYLADAFVGSDKTISIAAKTRSQLSAQEEEAAAA